MSVVWNVGLWCLLPDKDLNDAGPLLCGRSGKKAWGRLHDMKNMAKDGKGG